DIDLGLLELALAYCRRPWQAIWVVELFLRYCFSLWYAYFGSLDEVGDEFCGAAVDHVNSVGPTWAPMGLTLLANQYRGRLHLQATYALEAVPEALANAFLDRVVADLLK